MHSKSIDWFLYDRDLRGERVKFIIISKDFNNDQQGTDDHLFLFLFFVLHHKEDYDYSWFLETIRFFTYILCLEMYMYLSLYVEMLIRSSFFLSRKNMAYSFKTNAFRQSIYTNVNDIWIFGVNNLAPLMNCKNVAKRK